MLFKKHWFSNLLLIVGLISITSCQKEKPISIEPLALMEVPSGFPDIPQGVDNEFNEDRWALGKMLFYEKAMSLDSSISCASCHKSTLAFSDDVPFSLGVEDLIGTRNAPSLANVAYHPYYLREGGLSTLEQQVLVPIQEHNELNTNILEIAERLSKDEQYVQLGELAYGREPDPYVITRALGVFERTLISGNSPYDQHIYQGKNTLSALELSGLELFESDRLACKQCHGGFNFTDYSFQNNGLYIEYEDLGRMRLTGNESDRAKFKTPSLRNIVLTAPYMHDGSIANLESVIDHYASGGVEYANKSPLISGFDLTYQEKIELISFLQSLTDESFVNNPKFKQ